MERILGAIVSQVRTVVRELGAKTHQPGKMVSVTIKTVLSMPAVGQQ